MEDEKAEILRALKQDIADALEYINKLRNAWEKCQMKEYQVLVENTREERFLVKFKPLEDYCVEATIHAPDSSTVIASGTVDEESVESNLYKGRASITIRGNCNSKWVIEAISAAVEWRE